MLILYVEDEDDDVFFLRHAFKLAGSPHSLECVADGEQAILDLAGEGSFANRRSHPLPGLVILDINMPRRTGLEVLEWIRRQARFKSLPVLMLISSLRPEDLERARELGAEDYLPKGSAPLKLVDFVNFLDERWGSPPTASLD